MRAAQVGIDIVGQNVANANTPGYHRQVAGLATRSPVVVAGLERGTGVEVTQIDRVRSGVLEATLLEYSGDLASVETQLETARQLEALIGFGDGSLSDRVAVLYQRMEELSARPHDETGRRLVIEAAQSLADSFERLSGDLDRVRNASVEQANGIVEQIGLIANEIQYLNIEIGKSAAAGRSPNDLADRRDSLARELGDLLDVSIHHNDGSVLVGDGSVIIGSGQTPSLVLHDGAGGLQLQRGMDGRQLDLTRGALAGLIEDANSTVPQLRQSLDTLAAGIMDTLDAIHVRGVGLDGAFKELTGQRFIADSTQPLQQALPTADIRAGTFSISTLNDSTGERTLHQITVDPQADSLEDIAARLSEIDEIVATINSATGSMVIRSGEGFSFDFTGVGSDTNALPEMDETHLLSALGLNTFFIGTDAQTMNVNPELLASPGRLAASVTGQPGDSQNLTTMIESRFQPQAGLGGRTVEQDVGEIVAKVGSNVVSLESSSTSLNAVQANIESQIASISGVNPDEEVLRMLQYQRAYEAAARYISTVNDITLELLQII